MDPTLRAILLDWNWDPLILVGLAVTAGLYYIGYRRGALARTEGSQGQHPRLQWRAGHAWLFYGGLGTIFIALISPLDPLGLTLFTAHMLQHILLMMFAPPLLLLGMPVGPILHTIPRDTRRTIVRTLATRRLRRVTDWLTSPVGAAVIFNIILWGWHIPTVYDAALEHPGLHVLEHITMMVAGVLFWWPVVEPLPVWKRSQGLRRIAYPVVASIPGGALGVWISQVGTTPLYTFYMHTPRFWGISPTDDQQMGGSLMLALDEMVVFAAAALLFFRFLAEIERRQERVEALAARRVDGEPATPAEL